ncbi:Crp/Fnr family transcriptional regulator [Catellicoccus marimammalium]|uniref:Transcriptional regulator ArcR essential for anaerobic expression of the ADI pathway, Crp/Fnr family n=1 Tax=Catellicoccus marimammalium M35/04/3 TaxID=1234409 RepID=K8ZCS1_9ENTE|nr:Crp/Fnr family transcriptional regulator [Catellicoccus marimammalium]EKU27852.1 Transcriptional regulator ArcR essential for anaerobic expression of the ADI pathway, Crp/Fnr family [Catellicoccus marimammalium M35/04/3]
MKTLFLDILKHRPYSEEGQFLQNKIITRRYPKNQVLFYQWEDAQWIYMPVDGLVVLNRYEDNGDLLYHGLVLPDTFFPLTNVFGQEQYEYEAMTLTEVETWQMKKEDFILFLERFPQYYPQLCQDLVKINSRLEERLHFLMVASAKERIENIVLNLIEDYGVQQGDWNVLPWPITVTEIAQISGTTRETASLAMNQLRRNGSIRYEHKQLSLPI